MATWAPGTIVRDTGLGGGRRKLKITGAVPHIGAARSVLGFVVAPNSRSNYPTYHIASDGTLTGIVHPDRRPFTTAHSVDETAITFEIDNTVASHPWPISEAALMTLERVLLHHAREEGFSRFVLNRPGVDQTRDGFFIAGHRQYKSVACPGDWLWGRWPGIIDGLNRRIAGKAPAPAPKPPATSASASQGTTATRAQWRTIQDWLRRLGRYGGPVDGVPGPNTWRGIQTTVRLRAGYTGPVDGVPGPNTYRAMQRYAANGGGYRGPIDGVLGPNSWAGFVRRLSS